jgi:hypothetical protein
MTTQPASPAMGQIRPALISEAQHQHDRACYWDVHDCRWQCMTYSLLSYTLEPCTPSARPVLHTGPEARP